MDSHLKSGAKCVMTALLSVLMMSGAVQSERSKKAECEMWTYLENKTLPLQDKGHAVCNTNDECTGFTCNGQFKSKPVEFGMKVLSCQDPPGLEIFGYAPQFQAKNFSHVFRHGSRYEIPGAVFNLPRPNVSSLPTNMPGLPNLSGLPPLPGIKIYFVVTMEPNKEQSLLD